MNKARIILVSLLALLWAMATLADVEINETTFPDEKFRNWVLVQSYGSDGILTDEEIAGITTIVVVDKNIQNLKGIEYFAKLTSLDCSWNQLMTLDVSINIALTKLSCYGNQLTELDVSNNTDLNELYCFRNKLTELDVSNNIELTKLYCYENQLTELDVSKNAALIRILCSENLLTLLDVSGCTLLESLKCAKNKLTTLEVSGCLELYEVLCFCNRIKGEAMDALIAGLPILEGGGNLPIFSLDDEQNVMTKAQVAAAKAKGWIPRYKYGSFDTYGYTAYEGSDGGTAIVPPFGNTKEGTVYDLQGRLLSNKPSQGIYIEDGKKLLQK